MLWGPCPWNRGAYGKNLLNLGLRLKKAGHEVTHFVLTGLKWARLEYPVLECRTCHYIVHGKYAVPKECPVCQVKGKRSRGWLRYSIECLPNDSEDYGQNWLPRWNAIYEPDIVIFHYDVFVLGGYQAPREIKKIAWYMPVDHSPCPPPTINTLRSAGGVVLAMTRFAQKELKAAGIESLYLPHALDTNIYFRFSQAEARDRLELPRDAFILASVATNTGPRKNLPNVLDAFRIFLGQAPRARENAFLYMHTNITAGPDNRSGFNLPQFWHDMGIVDRIKYVHPTYYEAVGFTEAEMADVYRSADWTILCSLGEGFGMPYMESLACGTPVIYSNFAAAPEVAGPGGLPVEAVEDYRPAFELSSSFQWAPSTNQIAARMLEAYEDWETGSKLRNKLSRKGWRHVQQYAWPQVKPQWLELVKEKPKEPVVLERWGTPADGEVDIVVITHNHLEDLLERCVRSIYERTTLPFHLVVVDDQSIDGTREYVAGLCQEKGNVTYVRPAEKCQGGAQIMNIGLKHCRNQLVVSMNNDIEVTEGWLEEAVKVMESDPKIGVVGMKFLYPDDQIQHAGGIFIKAGLPYHLGIGEPKDTHSDTQEMPWVSGPCVLVRRECLDPGWDEVYDTFGGHEDVDLCLRARSRGWKVVYCGSAVVYHHEGATVLSMPDFGRMHLRAREIFIARWGRSPLLK